MPKRRVAIFFLSCLLLGGLSACVPQERPGKKIARSYSQYVKGLFSDRLGELEEAVAFYRQAQRLDEGAPAPRVQLGFDYIRLQKFTEALKEFQEAVSLDPEDTEARYVLALLYIRFDDYQRSCEQFEKLLEKNASSLPKNIQLRHILSQLYFLGGDYAQAKTHSGKILQLDPGDRRALYVDAMIAGEEGRIEDAVRGFTKFLELYPDSSDARNSLAYLLAEQNRDLGKALDLSLEAVAHDNFNPAYLDTLGWVYFKMGAFDKAIALLEKAAQLMPDAVIYDHLAQGYYEKGLKQKAKKYWTLSLTLDPRQESVRLRLRGF